MKIINYCLLVFFLFFLIVGFMGIMQYKEYPDAITSVIICCTYFAVGSIGLAITILVFNINKK